MAAAPLAAQQTSAQGQRDTSVVWGTARQIKAELDTGDSFTWQPSCTATCSRARSGNAASLIFKALSASIDQGAGTHDAVATLSVAMPAQLATRARTVTIHHTLRYAILKDAQSSAVLIVVVNGQSRTLGFLPGTVLRRNAGLVDFSVTAGAADTQHVVSYIVSAHHNGSAGYVKLIIDSDDVRIDTKPLNVAAK